MNKLRSELEKVDTTDI